MNPKPSSAGDAGPREGSSPAESTMPAGSARRVVAVWAPRCRECRAMKPLIRDVVGSRKDIDLEWLDASVETDRARSLGIRATPTLIGYVRDREVVRIVGRRSARELEEMVSSLHGGGRPGRGASRTDTILRTGTGIVLTAVGMLSGPAWPLAAVGAAITGYGLAGWRRSSR